MIAMLEFGAICLSLLATISVQSLQTPTSQKSSQQTLVTRLSVKGFARSEGDGHGTGGRRSVGHFYGFGVSQAALAKPIGGTEVSKFQLTVLRSSHRHHAKLWTGAFGMDGQSSKKPQGVTRLADISRSEFAGDIEIGTARDTDGTEKPQTTLRVIYDTGSSDLWIMSDLCKQWPLRRHYNHHRSETFQALANATEEELGTGYGDGEIWGVAGADVVRVGGLVARSQPLGLIKNASGLLFDLPIEGIVGLGLPKARRPTLSLFDTLMQQRAVLKNQFSFFFNRDRVHGGALFWGGIDARLYDGELHWFPVVDDEDWALEILELQVGNVTLFKVENAPGPRDKTPMVVIDSGSTYLTFPGDLYPAVTSTVKSSPCGSIDILPPLVYVLKDLKGAHHHLKVLPHQYMVKETEHIDEVCFPGVMRYDAGLTRPVLLLGEIFMRHYVTTFSRGDSASGAIIGIAPSKEYVQLDDLSATV